MHRCDRATSAHRRWLLQGECRISRSARPSQLPNIKYKPTTVIAAQGQSAGVFDAHFKSLKGSYGDVVAINLINHKGTGAGWNPGPLPSLFTVKRARGDALGSWVALGSGLPVTGCRDAAGRFSPEASELAAQRRCVLPLPSTAPQRVVW
jgi:hypothetical protein